MNEAFTEVNVSDVLMCRIYSASLLRTLMQRTGTGGRLTVRTLAEIADVPLGTLGALLSGAQQLLPMAKAHRVAAAVGVDLLVLFVVDERAARRAALRVPAPAAEDAPEPVSV
ncbi:hypothetical protein [Streptomyces sp. NPDC050560]|uniref:hypothetical protein n=1 Tax=Streptomyces sp. NPDC050560 TaxID=3365630 RepID=UPI003798BC1D